MIQITVESEFPGSAVESEAVVSVAVDDAIRDDVGSVEIDGGQDDQRRTDRRLPGQVTRASVFLKHRAIVVGTGIEEKRRQL